MNRQDIIARLRENEAALRGAAWLTLPCLARVRAATNAPTATPTS